MKEVVKGVQGKRTGERRNSRRRRRRRRRRTRTRVMGGYPLEGLNERDT